MPRCRLRPVEPSDVAVFFEHQADPEAAAMAAFPSRDRDAHDAHWAHVLADPATVNRTVLECHPDGDLVAGNMASYPAGDRRFVGYWLGRDFWGRGLATAGLRLFLAELPDRPLAARVVEHNRASVTVLRRCGFRLAGSVHLAEEDLVELEFVLP
jgi:RimJ/RimL family protein N-acetyltransferase